LARARSIIESRRLDYNGKRPHKAVGNQTPEEFARGAQTLLPLDLSAA
jgi:transposase InsO family protein